MIKEDIVTQYTCSDGSRHLNRPDAEVHEAELALKAVCDEHGYSGSFTRTTLFEMLREHASDFAPAINAYYCAVEAKKASLASGGQGSLAEAFTGKKSTDVRELQRRVEGLRAALHDINEGTKEPGTRTLADNALDAFPAVGIART